MVKEEITLSSNKIAVRVSKPQARKYYNNGLQIRLVPVKCRVDGMFSFDINNVKDGDNFEAIYNSCCFYNTGNELGQYLKCYLIKEVQS